MKLVEVEQLNERARGLTSRKPGEIFQDRLGKNIVMQRVVTFPESGQYDTPEELAAALEQWEQESNLKIDWKNNQTAATKAALVAVFKDEANRLIAFGRYYRTIPPILDGMWSNTQFTRDTGYQLQREVSIKETLPIKPINLIGTDRSMSVPYMILLMRSNIRTLDLPSELKSMLDITVAQMSGRVLPRIKGGAQYATVFENYLGEILAPFALVKNVGLTGQHSEAENTLLKPHRLSFSKMNIRFPMTAANFLTDSELVSPDGQVIVGISSKASSGGGAAASLKGLYEVIQDLEPELITRYKRAIDFIKLVVENSQKMGPVIIAQNIGLITGAQASQLSDLIDNKTKSTEGVFPDLLKFAQYIVADTTRPSYTVGYHILAGLARTIADIYNEDPIFDEAIRVILNKRSMVQVYAKVKAIGDDLQFSEFNVVYPPNFTGKVFIDSKKVYFSTGINGKFAFKMR